MMVFSPRRSNRISPINDVIIPPIKIPRVFCAGSREPEQNHHSTQGFASQNRSCNNNTERSVDTPLIQNDDVADKPRSPSSTRSAPIFRTSSMQSLYNGYPKFTMFNLAPSSDCSSCGNKK